ncbi:MAG: SLC13 family permease [Nitrososphaerota archaeon]|nr:SLC13 family permease [Candidatus Calditenuaceae archaeon]MDW8073009.1 SLC13 family permease [Nitrososphaerota archaeon]
MAFAFIGIFILLITGLLDVPHLVEFAGLDIIVFLIGMMVVVGFLEERHFFEYLLNRVVRLGRTPLRLLFILMGMAALSAALVDEVTSILFMASLVLHLSSRLAVSFIPLIILVVFATNIGSSATVVGNPVGVMIALRAGLSFTEFLRWASPISVATLLITLAIGYLYYRNYFATIGQRLAEYAAAEAKLQPDNGGSETLDKKALFLFIFTISLLVAHTSIEDALGLEKNTVLVAAPLLGGAIALLLQREHARELFEKRVDWWTLAFFLMFFATVGTLKYVGTTRIFAQVFSYAVGDNLALAIPLLGYVAGFMSAFMDNILAVAVWIPIIQELGTTGLPIYPLWWVLLFAGTLMGNLTIIGSTANIVAIGMVERQRIGHITLRDWILIGALVSIPTFSLALLLIYLQLPMML